MPWKIANLISSKPLPAKAHYYIMLMFRLFFKSYFVWINYPNPISRGKTIRLLVNLCENNQQWYFRLRNRYELKEIKLIAEAMKEAEIFFDIGSNIGVYATTIAQAFPDKRVVAIEPLRKNFDSLRVNITANDVANCKTIHGAVSNISTTQRFYINPIHDGGGSLIASGEYITGDVVLDAKRYQEKHPEFQPFVEVETFQLDEMLSNKSVLKIDVEGAELDVIKSGYKALRNGLVDLMIVEVLQETVDDILDLVGGLEFDAFLLPDYIPITVGAQLPWFVMNVLCVRKNTPQHETILMRMNQHV